MLRIRYSLIKRMEFFTEHVVPDWAVSETVKESVDECVLTDRVFCNTTCKVAKVLRISVHITLALLEPEERRACSGLSSWRLKIFLSRDFKTFSDPNV